MKKVSISGSPRENVGKKDAQDLRRNGRVPCVLYGGKEQIHFSADVKDFKNLIYTPEVNLATITVNGNSYEAALQEVQFHPVNDSLVHVDFVQIFADKPSKIDIPVKLTGTAEGVRAGGKLILKQRLLKVKGLPADLPETIEVNVENLTVGGVIRVREISPEKLTVLTSPSAVIATVKGKRGMATTEAPKETGKKK